MAQYRSEGRVERNGLRVSLQHCASLQAIVASPSLTWTASSRSVRATTASCGCMTKDPTDTARESRSIDLLVLESLGGLGLSRLIETIVDSSRLRCSKGKAVSTASTEVSSEMYRLTKEDQSKSFLLGRATCQSAHQPGVSSRDHVKQ